MDSSSSLPTIDLSVFLQQVDEDVKKKAMLEIEQACIEYGFFLAINHGVPLKLMSQALEVSKSFFNLPDHDKLDYSLKPVPDSPPIGYVKSQENFAEKNEHLFMVSPTSACSQCPPQFQQVLEEIYPYFSKLGSLVENIVNDCLGLPRDFLKEYNNDRSWDFVIALHYFPASETENLGKACHSDGNSITFVFQDGVGGLEVYKDGKWIAISPPEGTLVVNIGDIIQVLSNDKFKSAPHRVVRQLGKSRYSYAFVYAIGGDKMIEPLSHFTVNKGESSKYKGFLYKDYVQLRVRNKTHPPASPEDIVGITHYAISKS